MAYDVICREFANDDHDTSQWLALGELLAARVGWRFEVDGLAGLLWAYGLRGAARLVVTLERGEFVLHDHDNDVDHVLPTVAELAEWLDAHEQEHAGLTRLQHDLRGR